MIAAMAKPVPPPSPWEQLPLLPGTPGMEPPGAHLRRRPMSPAEHDLEDALRILDPDARARNVARIEARTAAFDDAFRRWQNAHRHVDEQGHDWFDGCDRCGNRVTDACLLYDRKAYCAVCRTEVWADMGKRVGLYR